MECSRGLVVTAQVWLMKQPVGLVGQIDSECQNNKFPSTEVPFFGNPWIISIQSRSTVQPGYIHMVHMGVEPKIRVGPKSSIGIIHFGIPLFLETPIYVYHISLSIQVCPKVSGFPRTNPILGMGCFDHQSHEFSGGIWILRVCFVLLWKELCFFVPLNHVLVSCFNFRKIRKIQRISSN